MNRVTLTFDNGPHPGATERILDILAAREIKATFFVIGQKLLDPARRKLAERAHVEGHWIGNHTMTHRAPFGDFDDPLDAVREIERAETALGDLARPSRLFRPVGRGELGPHLLNDAALDHLLAERYTVVTWNNVPRDYEEPHRAWLPRALATARGQEWSLVVLHDHALADMMDTLVTFLDRCRADGARFPQAFPDGCVPARNGELRVARDLICR